MSHSPNEVPLFPLGSVVLPGGRLPLQLFETRYLDMLTRCLKDGTGFVVLLLREGAEAGRRATFHDIGTYVRIIDFQQMDNGLLGITVEGDAKVRVESSRQQADGLHLGVLRDLEPEPESGIPPQYQDLPPLLEALCRHPVVDELQMAVDFTDARDVGWRLTELLPLDADQKQSLMELQDPVERLDRLQALVEELEGN
ncbi:LON peptidase substrate-binding domain-containing protein [Marinobacter oulmenensis]|uniref:Lon N-terminal domain-containing protein n=1 Tax=Marinobacter oulmenensis TaxID=643747 RepID=A0A840UC46_9GAMM|nr:hypothetical protein [Marinobacter oulmenensis]